MNVKKMLKDGAKQILPDEGIKEKIKYRMGVDTESEVSLGAVKAKRRNKVIIAVSCALASVIAVCAFIPLMLKKSGAHSPTSPTDPGGIFGELSTADEVYGFSAASAMVMLGGTQNSVASSYGLRAVTLSEQMAGPHNGGNAQSDADDLENIEKINKYMQIAESLTSDGGYTVTAGENGGDYAQYGYALKVAYTDALGVNRDGGTLYFNKTFTNGEIEDDESEVTYSLDGIMVTDGNEYPLRGTHQSETESDESEDEYVLCIELGDGRYILVEQQYENESENNQTESETEYCYTLYQARNGAQPNFDREGEIDFDEDEFSVISRTTIEYETEHDETELVITAESNEGRQTFAFEAENGRMLVRLGGAFTEVVYTVDIENGQYVYTRGGREIGREERGKN